MKKLLLKTHIDGYTKKDGTFVAPHEDKRHKKSSKKPALNQLSLDLDPYEHIETRPDTTPEQKDAGRAALKDLLRRLNRLRGSDGKSATLLGTRLFADFKASGATELVGKYAASPGDIATLAQVYRDPRFETFRCVYMKDGKVVGEAAYSSRLPGNVELPLNIFAAVSNDKNRYGADGYYLIHNHPSGKSQPSKADAQFTVELNKRVPGFISHVVIDHDEYSVIDSDGKHHTVTDQSLAGIDFSGAPAMEHPALGKPISSPQQAAVIAKSLQADGVLDRSPVMVLTKGTDAIVELVASAPASILIGKKGRSGAWLRGVMRAAGAGSNSFLVVNDQDFIGNQVALGNLIADGLFTDVVSSNGVSLRSSGIPAGKHIASPRRPGRKVSESEPLTKSIEQRYQHLLVRRTGGDPVAMAKEDAKINGRVDLIFRRDHEPSAAQKKSNRYPKKRRVWNGLDIDVENEAGTVRSGRWGDTRMKFDYGYVVGSCGVDGDEVDVYVGPNEQAPMVYVVHQRRAGDWENYDEDKAMLGFDTVDDAAEAYLAHYNDPRFLGPITPMPVEEFRCKVMATKDKPAMIKAHESDETTPPALLVKRAMEKRAQEHPNGSPLQSAARALLMRRPGQPTTNR